MYTHKTFHAYKNHHTSDQNVNHFFETGIETDKLEGITVIETGIETFKSTFDGFIEFFYKC